MADLPTNLKDDILDSSVNTKRKYRMIDNEDGTYSFEDATEYSQVGDEYGAGLINETNRQVNARVEKAVVVPDLATIGAITQPGFIPDALALKDVNDSLTSQIFNLSHLTYQQALDQILTFENVPLWKSITCTIVSSDCGYQLAKITALSPDWISGTSFPAVSGGGKSYVFTRNVSGGASTEIRPFSGGGINIPLLNLTSNTTASITFDVTDYKTLSIESWTAKVTDSNGYFNPSIVADESVTLLSVSKAGVFSNTELVSNFSEDISSYSTLTVNLSQLASASVVTNLIIA